MTTSYICQLPKKQQEIIKKFITKRLTQKCVFTQKNLDNAMTNRVYSICDTKRDYKIINKLLQLV